MTLLSVSSLSSVDRAPARFSGGRRFDSCSDFILSHAGVMLIKSSFFTKVTSVYVNTLTSGFHFLLHYPMLPHAGKEPCSRLHYLYTGHILVNYTLSRIKLPENPTIDTGTYRSAENSARKI